MICDVAHCLTFATQYKVPLHSFSLYARTFGTEKQRRQARLLKKVEGRIGADLTIHTHTTCTMYLVNTSHILHHTIAHPQERERSVGIDE